MKKTKIGKVQAHLDRGKSITALSAFKLYGTMRLSGIIYVLKEKGMAIKTTLVTKNGSTFARYRRA